MLATMIETITDGTVMTTEFQKPDLRPSQFNPVQAVDQALAQASKDTSEGRAKTLPSRISGIVFSDVTIMM